MNVVRKVSGVVLGVSTLIMPLAAFAATKTWDGGGADNYWSTAANWDSDARPGTGDTILFDGTGKKNAIIGSNAFKYPINELRMTTANTGTLTVGKALVVRGSISLSGGTIAVQGGSQITVHKNWQNGGGTFTAGTGTVVLTGSGDANLLKETAAFNHLTLNDGLQAYWKFDEATGTFVEDSSGNGNTGTLRNNNGTATSTSRNTADVPAAISFADPRSLNLNENTLFDVAGVQMTASSSTTLASWRNGQTVSLWVKPKTGYSHYFDRIIEKGYNSEWFIIYDSGTSKLYVASYLASGNDYIYTSALTVGEWNHVVGIIRPGSLSVYINGALVETKPIAAITTTNNGDISIGCDETGSYCTNSSIDDVRIYNRPLSTSEIQALYAGGLATGSGYYTLGSALTVNGSLGVYSGTMDVSSSNYGVTASGSFIASSQFTPRSGTVTLSGIGTNLKLFGSTLYNLAIASSKSAILRGNGTISNLLSVASSATLTFNGFDLTATNATITNNGTISQGTGSIIHPSTSYSVTPSSLAIGSSLNLTITDSDENIDGTAQDTLTVAFDDDTATLTETTSTSGIFTGTVSTSNSDKVYGNGILESNDRCLLTPTFTYIDPEDDTDTHSTTITITNSSISCTNGTASGGGPTGGGGGGGGRRTQAIASTVSSSGDSSSTVSSKAAENAKFIFSDVSSNDWFFTPIKTLIQRGILGGYKDTAGNLTGEFGPTDPVTIGQILKIALLSSNHNLPSSLPLPKNPTANDWSAPYIAFGELLGIDLASQASQRSATRGEVIHTLLQAFDVDLSIADNPFSDLQADHIYNKDILTAVRLGVVKGDDKTSTVRPDDLINRAEVATLVVRIMDKVHK